jgi:hypothetical protein
LCTSFSDKEKVVSVFAFFVRRFITSGQGCSVAWKGLQASGSVQDLGRMLAQLTPPKIIQQFQPTGGNFLAERVCENAFFTFGVGCNLNTMRTHLNGAQSQHKCTDRCCCVVADRATAAPL